VERTRDSLKSRPGTAVPSFSSGLSCPSCDLPLTLIFGRNPFAFSCDCGHSYLLNHLLRAQSHKVIGGLLEVARVWEERIGILRDMAARALLRGHPLVASSFHQEVGNLEARLQVLRGTLMDAPAGQAEASGLKRSASA
jgi:hypothetical protein